MLTVLDFHVRLASPDHYSLDVFARGSSQPLARAALDYPLSFLTEFALKGLEPDFRDAEARVNRLEQFGRNLYQKLFTEDVERVWKEHKAASEFLVLCLRIAPDARGLEALPWETLYDGEEFIAAGGKTGLTRLSLDLAPQDDLPPVELPLRMFASVSSPLDPRCIRSGRFDTVEATMRRRWNSINGRWRSQRKSETVRAWPDHGDRWH